MLILKHTAFSFLFLYATGSGSLRRMASRFWKEHPKEFALFRTSQKNSTQSFKHIVNDVNGFPPYDAVWEVIHLHALLLHLRGNFNFLLFVFMS